jgi:hypothetical protein
MKQISGFLLATLIVMACRKSDSCTPAHYSYFYNENKKLDTIRPGGYFLFTQIGSGNNMVFSYHFTGEFCKDRSDGPTSEYLLFEVPSQVTQFDYSSNNIKDLQCYYHYELGDGSTSDAVKILEGIISGVKTSESTWSIQASIVIPNMNKTLTFNHTYNRQ